MARFNLKLEGAVLGSMFLMFSNGLSFALDHVKPRKEKAEIGVGLTRSCQFCEGGLFQLCWLVQNIRELWSRDICRVYICVFFGMLSDSIKRVTSCSCQE